MQDGNSDLLLVNNLSQLLIQDVAFSGTKVNWSLVEQLIALLFDFYLCDLIPVVLLNIVEIAILKILLLLLSAQLPELLSMLVLSFLGSLSLG